MEEGKLEQEIQQELAIDDTHIEGEMKRQPGKFFYWGTLQAKAANRVRNEKARLDASKAEEAKTFKENTLKEDSKIRITERMLDDYLDLNETIRGRKNALIEAQYSEELLSTAVEAFRQRHYSIVELAKSKESERMAQNEFSLMKREYEAKERKK